MLIFDFVFRICQNSGLPKTELIYTLSIVGTLRGYDGLMVNQSQKIQSVYRAYE